MPKFCDTYTDEQRRAIIAAVLDKDGPRLSRKAAWRAAAAGQLPGYTGPAFQMSYTYVCQIVGDEQARREPPRYREAEKQPAAAVESMARRMLRVEERELARIEREQRTGERNAGRLLLIGRNLEQIAKVFRAATTLDDAPSGSGTPDTKGKDETTAAQGLLARLAAEDDANATPRTPTPRDTGGGTADERDTTPTPGEGEDAARDTERQDDEERAEPVRSRSRDSAADLRGRLGHLATGAGG